MATLPLLYIGSSWHRPNKTRDIYSNHLKGPAPLSRVIRRLQDIRVSDSVQCTFTPLRMVNIKYKQTCLSSSFSMVGGYFTKFVLSLLCCRNNACRHHPYSHKMSLVYILCDSAYTLTHHLTWRVVSPHTTYRRQYLWVGFQPFPSWPGICFVIPHTLKLFHKVMWCPA